MIGTIALTDLDWYKLLLEHPEIDEVNFWRPSAYRRFNAPDFSPFVFKLHAPHNAICGFAFFASWSRLPMWLAWDTFGLGNGCSSLHEMEARLATIRRRIRYVEGPDSALIGCTMLVQPMFFPRERWVEQPRDWRVRTQSDKKYDLDSGDGRRVWQECLATARELPQRRAVGGVQLLVDGAPRYGPPAIVRPRLGQKTFRIAVTDAYGRSCAITGEHSLPALEAGHIVPFGEGGPHEISNGILLRADLHRLFDKGYLTITPDLRTEVSRRLREEYRNGHTYYPLAGQHVTVPRDARNRPDPELLRWHNQSVFAA